ncbi:MAG: VanZ family protein [Lachnospiraceae bacterium]|nr:VanZ family protein [Lachnospiraceae bacterium]
MKKNAIKILFVIYMLSILRITIFRSGISFEHLLEGRINISLFQSYVPLLETGDWIRIVYLFVGNIIWFIPFGMYLQWCGKWKLKGIIMMGFCFSLFIEVMQYVLGTGISELDDLILNTAGAAIGAWIIKNKRNARCF